MKFRDYIEKNAILKMSGLTPDGDTVDIIKVGYYAVSEEEFKKDNRYKGWLELDIHVFDNNGDYHLDVNINFTLNRVNDEFVVEVPEQYQLLGEYSKEKHLKMVELFELISIYYNCISFSVSDMLKSEVKENEIKKYS